MTTYCGSRRTTGHGEADICGEMGPGGVHQCAACELKDHKAEEQKDADKYANYAQDALVKAIARVAHESVAAHNSAYGDYTTPPWERLPEKDKDHTCAKVAAFLNNPDLHPTAHHGTSVAVLTASQRAAAYVFHGVVHAIAREQSRD